MQGNIETCNKRQSKTTAGPLPDGQGATTRRVLATEACSGGKDWSYTVKVTVNLVPMAAAAVSKAQGVSPTLANW